MASFDVIPMEHSSSGSFQSGEYSFLPEVSVHPGENGVSNILVNGEFDLTNMQSTLSTASPDLSVEEVHSRLVELVEENQSLKEALHKNNSLMKDQITTISAWREDMILAKNQQGQSLKMTKEQISLLEKENAELQEKLSNLEIACEVLKNPESCGNCKSLETVLQSLQTENMSMETSKKILVEEIDGMTQFQEQIRQNLLGIYNQLHNFLRPSCKIPRKEKEELNVALQCLGTKLGVLGGDLGATLQTDEETGYVVINQKEQQAEGTFLQNSSEVESLKKDLEAKNKELDIFRKREEELCQMIKSHEKKLEENEMQQKATYELMNSKQERDTSLSDKYKERCESLQQQIDEYQVKLDKAKMSDDHRVEQLREEAKNLQDILKLEQRANQKDKDKLAEVMEKCEQLQVDHDRVTKILEIQTRDEKMKSEEVATRRESEVKDYMEQFDFLTAKSLDMEEQLGEKQEEINKLKEKLSEVWEESETIPILKAQIEVYKTDLQHAVSTRDTAHAEIENLERELKRFKKHDSDHRKSGHHAKDDTARTEVFSCPFCDMGFNTVNAAENHIEQKHTEKM